MRTTFSTLALASVLALAGGLAGCQTQATHQGSYYNAKPPGPSLPERRLAGYETGFDTNTPNNNGRNNAEATVPDNNLGSGVTRIGLNFD